MKAQPGHFLKSNGGGILCAFVFVMLGLLFVGYPGLQTDEVMFAAPLYRDWCFSCVSVAGIRIPLMQISYTGALKTWIYTPILFFSAPTAMAIRLPALLIGSITILLLWRLLDGTHGRLAAWFGCALLATDSILLLTTTIDWGPVALQHLLTVLVMILAVRCFRAGSDRVLVALAFCTGLALWNKAIFIWTLGGLLCGLLLFVRPMLQRLTWRRLRLFAGGFLLGLFPLIVYNWHAPAGFSTFGSNAQFEAGGTMFGERLSVLRGTWNGSGLFGALVYDDAETPRAPVTLVERTSAQVRSVAGEHRTNFQEIAIVAAVLLVPLFRRGRVRRTLVFCMVAMGVGWLLMVTTGGGGSPHHTVLLWPFPQMLVGVAFAEACRDRAKWMQSGVVAVVCVLVAANLLVTNEYLYKYWRNGATVAWTDAINPLAAKLEQTPASQVILGDWGMYDSLTVMSRGALPTTVAPYPFELGAEPDDANRQLIKDEQAVWVLHTADHEIREGANEDVFAAAREAGVEPVVLNRYSDRNGREVFQTLRFRPSAGPAR